MIKVTDLKVHYGSTVAVDHLSFSVEPGSIYGLVGPNGAGKTSAIKTLATLIEPTYGEVIINGYSCLHEPEKVRGFLGYMPDFPPVYDDLKVWEFCDLFAHAYGLRGEEKRERVLQSLHATFLSNHMHVLCKTLSRGMRQKALLAKTLVHEPSVLLLDEPAANLDPKSRIDLRNILKKLADSGKSILLSSHILSEIEDTCDSLGFMSVGKMVKSGSMDEILVRNQGGSILRIHLSSPAPNLLEIVDQINSLSKLQAKDDQSLRYQAIIEGGKEEASQVLTKLVEAKIPVSEFSLQQQSVEDLFLQLESQALK